MIKFTAKEREALLQAAGLCEQTLAEMVRLTDEYNEEMRCLAGQFDEEKEPARAIIEDAANAADEYHSDKSEKWQESDRGQAYQEWVSRLQQVADSMGEPLEIEAATGGDLPDWMGDLTDEELLEFTY